MANSCSFIQGIPREINTSIIWYIRQVFTQLPHCRWMWECTNHHVIMRHRSECIYLHSKDLVMSHLYQDKLCNVTIFYSQVMYTPSLNKSPQSHIKNGDLRDILRVLTVAISLAWIGLEERGVTTSSNSLNVNQLLYCSQQNKQNVSLDRRKSLTIDQI